MGQTHVQKLLTELLNFIQIGALKPEIIITHRLPLTEAARGYEMFSKMEDDCRKIILLPGETQRSA